MQIKINGSSELIITGNIKSIEDSQAIKSAIGTLLQQGAKGIRLKIEDSFSMTSTVIGHLMKLVNLDKIAVSLAVEDPRLYELLDELNLVQDFNVRLDGRQVCSS